jgi:inorganic phosphate transporter, PiT family
MTTAMIFLLILALIYDFLNGVHDSSNVVALPISSRAIPSRLALTITAIAEFFGPFIFGVAVATTIGSEIVQPDTINMATLISALTGAISWNLLTWYLGLPSSSSHALFGGLIGAVVAGFGWSALNMQGVSLIFLTLFTSPIIGFIVGYLMMRLIMLLCWNASPNINWFFKKGQYFTLVFLALSHGSNDAQKSMGIITLGLVTSGFLTTFAVPTWVIFLCSTMIALGTYFGGWRLIRTLGAKFYRIRPINGFSAQLSAASVILGASLIGGPVSTTQVVSSAIMGVGSAERVNKVRWGVAKDIALAWVFTIPATALVGGGIYLLIERLIP